MSKYLNDVMPEIQKGEKARRMGWPEGKYITSTETKEVVIGAEQVSKKVEIDGTQQVGKAVEIGGHPISQVNVSIGGQSIQLANNVVLIDPTKADKEKNRPAGVNLLGWVPTQEEKFSMDWEVIEQEVEG